MYNSIKKKHAYIQIYKLLYFMPIYIYIISSNNYKVFCPFNSTQKALHLKL